MRLWPKLTVVLAFYLWYITFVPFDLLGTLVAGVACWATGHIIIDHHNKLSVGK